MNKIRLLLLSFLIFLVCGCSVKYNLVIATDGISEEFITYYENNKENEKIVNQLAKQEAPAYYDINNNTTNYYTITKYGNKNSSKLALKYNYIYRNHVKLQESNVLKQCFYNVSVVKDAKYLTLMTSEGADCLSKDGEQLIDKIDVNIKSSYKVVESNADKVSNGNYIWNITEKNSNKKSIYMKLDYNAKKKKTNNNYVYIILGILIIGGPILLILLRSRKNKKYGY